MKPKSLYMIIGVFLFIIIGVFVVYNEKKRVLKRELNKVEFTEISNLKQNDFSKVKGSVTAITNPLVSPLSKKECVYYSFKIQENKKTGKNDRWSTIHFEEQIQAFLVESDNESVLVKPSITPKNFESIVKIDETVSEFTKKNSSEKIEAFLKEYKAKANPNVGFGISIRAIESIIQADDIVTAAGTVGYGAIEKSITEERSFSKMVTLNGSIEQKLIITDSSLIDSKK